MFNIKQRADRIKKIIAYNTESRQSFTLPVVCVRKPVSPLPSCPYFCFVSNPGLINTPLIDPFMWLHCYRNESLLPTDAPKYLFPESDCVDRSHCPFVNRKKTTMDYIYFTISGHRGDLYKGFGNFLKDVVILKKLGLTGMVVFYNGTRELASGDLKSLQRCNVKIHNGYIPRARIAKVMSQAKFGLFPNKMDCSPRMIPEFFLQNRPVIVNRDITGGWHYVEGDVGFGSLYKPGDEKSLQKACENILKLPNNQRSLWESKYGFVRGAKRLSNLIREHHDCSDLPFFTHAYFKEYRKVFSGIPELFDDSE